MRTLFDPRARSHLLARLESVTPDRERRWGRMSAHQMICHLNDTFRVSLGERTASPTGNLLARTLGKAVALRTPLPWPHGVRAAPELDQERRGTPGTAFAADRERLNELIERFATHHPARWPDHPFFGPMSREDWGVCHYRHIDHHLKQFGA